ncbi:MAG: OB-fold nucleic acid binding domain-containing protein [Nanoarchaeota archaeon]
MQTKITLTISLLGILLLLILANILEPPHKNLGEITQKDINKKIMVEGKIIKIKTYKTATDEFVQSLTLKDASGVRQIVLFNAKNDNMLKEKNSAKIIGRVNLYKKEIQIVAEKIIVIKK